MSLSNGIDSFCYIFFVPLAAGAWSGMVDPYHKDFPLAAFHGVLAYVVSWAVLRADRTSNASNLFATLSVTLSSGIASRFTGKNALANSFAGLHVLLPGAYMVNEIYGAQQAEEFL